MANQKDDLLKEKNHLLAYDIIKSTASWIENPDNEIFGLLEYDDDSLNIMARAAVIASAVLKKAAMDIQVISGVADTNKYEKDIVDAMNELKVIADELDLSGDEKLMKKASVLDEILVTMASSVEAQENLKRNFEKKIAEIKARSKSNGSFSQIKTSTEARSNEKSGHEARPLEASLSTRYCPKCGGGMTFPTGEDEVTCTLCHAKVNYREGYTKPNGTRVPGTSADRQTEALKDVSIDGMFV